MGSIQTPPQTPAAARRFNLAVAALVFIMMLIFAGWVIASSVARGDGAGVNAVRMIGGAMIGVAAMMLLAAVRTGWHSVTPFQHGRMAQMGFALFGLGAVVLVAT
jgi:hypothetical protein